MTDHLHLVNQLAHHDAAISALGSRMTGVESSLGHVQEKVGTLDSKVSAGFSNLESLVREGKASQGPTLGELLKGVATGGAIVGMSAGAITMLVTSFVEPKVVSLETKTTWLEEREKERMEVDRTELHALKERRREYVDDTLDKLSAKAARLLELRSWDAEVKKVGE